MNDSLDTVASASYVLALASQKIFWPRPHTFWPWPHPSLAKLTSLDHDDDDDDDDDDLTAIYTAG